MRIAQIFLALRLINPRVIPILILSPSVFASVKWLHSPLSPLQFFASFCFSTQSLVHTSFLLQSTRQVTGRRVIRQVAVVSSGYDIPLTWCKLEVQMQALVRCQQSSRTSACFKWNHWDFFASCPLVNFYEACVNLSFNQRFITWLNESRFEQNSLKKRP